MNKCFANCAEFDVKMKLHESNQFFEFILLKGLLSYFALISVTYYIGGVVVMIVIVC